MPDVAVLFDNRLHLPLFKCPEPLFFTKNTRKTRQNSPLPPPTGAECALVCAQNTSTEQQKKAFGKWSLPSFISLKPLEQQDAQPIGTSAWRDLKAPHNPNNPAITTTKARQNYQPDSTQQRSPQAHGMIQEQRREAQKAEAHPCGSTDTSRL